MKKIKALLTLGLALGTLGGIAAAFGHSANSKVVKADPEEESYIEMSTDFFTNWTNDAGYIGDQNSTFWGEHYSFEALGKFYCGESAGDWRGTLTSRTWKQRTQYVYFQFGGACDYARDDANNDYVHLEFKYGENTVKFYNNTFVENPMTLRYYKIPDEVFSGLSKDENGYFDMSVDVVDYQPGGNYGLANFGYLHVNQTLESTADAMRYFLNHLSSDSRDWKKGKRKAIFNSYYENSDQRAVFFASVGDNIDDTFNSNDDFLKNWYFDHNYFNDEYGTARHFDKAISTSTYRPGDNTNLPFNNNNGFFRGWFENDTDGGFVGADNLKYRFVSRPFTLSGTGIVSIKMAGKASLHVLNPLVQNTIGQDADVAWIDNRALNTDGWEDSGRNIADTGFNTTTMVNHVINLEAYLGKTIQLAIADVDTSGWSACYYDDLVTKYTAAPGYHIDVVSQENNHGKFYPVYPDIYINSTRKSDQNERGVNYLDRGINKENENAILNHVDSSNSLPAYNVWKSYFDTVRNGKVGQNYCSSRTSESVQSVLNSYISLSEGAKRIVCKSDDFERVGDGDWYKVNPTVYGANDAYNIANSLQYLANENSMSLVVYSSGLVYAPNNVVDNPSLVVAVITTAALVCVVALFFYTRKRKVQ